MFLTILHHCRIRIGCLRNLYAQGSQFPAQSSHILPELDGMHTGTHRRFHVGRAIVNKNAGLRRQTKPLIEGIENIVVGLQLFSSAETISPSKHTLPGILWKYLRRSTLALLSR